MGCRSEISSDRASGDQKAIDTWREAEALARTRVRRPYLLEENRIDKKR